MADPQSSPLVAEPRFTNLARVRHNATEFYIDFGQQLLDQPGVASIVAALVMTPQHAKLLAGVLTNSIEKFEAKNGEIRLPPPPPKEVVQ